MVYVFRSQCLQMTAFIHSTNRYNMENAKEFFLLSARFCFIQIIIALLPCGSKVKIKEDMAIKNMAEEDFLLRHSSIHSLFLLHTIFCCRYY